MEDAPAHGQYNCLDMGRPEVNHGSSRRSRRSKRAAANGRRGRTDDPYSRDDLQNDWEFKIVRSHTGAFRKTATLQKLMAEEARAGWQFVEKFDNGRVRFKRPSGARQRDAMLPAGVDPYRANYGLSEGAFVATILLVVFGATAIVIAMAVLFSNGVH